MHEYPFMQSVIKTASAHALENKASAVTAIRLVVGDGTGYVPESMQMYFDILSRGTPCEGATVEIRHVKPLLRCEACGREFERTPLSFDCPDCGCLGSPTDVGKELYIEEIEIMVDEGDEQPHEGNTAPEGDGRSDGRERPAGSGDAPGV